MYILFGLFGSGAESDASIQRDGFKLNVEAVAVGVCPGADDAIKLIWPKRVLPKAPSSPR